MELEKKNSFSSFPYWNSYHISLDELIKDTVPGKMGLFYRGPFEFLDTESFPPSLSPKLFLFVEAL